MEEKELKTSTKQRIIIGLIAFIMVGSMVASYAAIVISGNKSKADSVSGEEAATLSEERMKYYQDNYAEKVNKLKEVAAGDFAVFSKYVSTIGTYDEEAANNSGVTSKDLYAGSGRTLAAGDTDYLAYYVGWCADGTVFDSSLDSDTSPTAFAKALDASIGMIEGWNDGVVGMQLGGVREITMPSAKVYGEDREICGGYNKPLRFLMMAVANTDPLKTAASEATDASMKLQYASYGIDYDEQIGSSVSEE